MRIVNVSKKYGNTVALDNISFDVVPSSIIGVIGHNGSGKTTLLEILMGIQKQTSGQILNVNPELKEFKEKMGVILQENAVYENITVGELLRLFASYYKDTYDIDYLVDVLNMHDFKGKLYSKLSGGMKQKVNLALAFINKPKYVFLDEPTTGLDPIARKNLWNALNVLCKDTTVFLSSHYMEEVEQNCQYLVYLDDGNLIYSGSIDKFKNLHHPKALSEIYISISGGEYNDNDRTVESRV
ncbi:ABC-2 type transport system ATP-binding protein [Gracilibacillus orientalis]|uniref:ABC-2 type transport system ATP-binding protein n=1 Tax=Gracilibacillus orientalis TaxID=334253 RepID=A0A1I4J805_9BACI|nr:ABC transporter ATP-binding protein [Gracilibacillus orientalis]SFL62341.1 ABC-2 type transport system ATP-binding protein [Gracilibacillus orientalis]